MLVVREMRSIILTYPEFQSLPRGVKQLLLASENFYFGEPEPADVNAQLIKPKDMHPLPFPVVAHPEQTAGLRAA